MSFAKLQLLLGVGEAKARSARKALAAFVVPNAAVIIALVTARYGDAVAAEVVAVLTSLGVYHAVNA